MRVLVTGIGGLIGRSIAGLLAGRGDEVVGLSVTAPREMPPGVRFCAANVMDRSAVAAAMSGIDTVIYCREPATEKQTHQDLFEGTAKVIAAAEAAGVLRAICISSSAVYGPRRAVSQSPSSETEPLAIRPRYPFAYRNARCERLFAQSSILSVRVRAGMVLGRGIEGDMRNLLAGNSIPVAAGQTYPWSVIHHDDLARFVVCAVDSDRTGPVNVATDDTVDTEGVARLLGRKISPVSNRLVRRGLSTKRWLSPLAAGDLETLLRFPLTSVASMHRDWGFAPVWSGIETVEDTRLAVNGVTAKWGKLRRRKGRTAYPHQIVADDIAPSDGAPLAYSGPEDLRGEFDTPIDPRFPVYSQTNLSEALPGPSSVLTLDVQCRSLRGTTSAVAEMLSFSGALGTEASARLQAVHAHRVYINGSGAYHVSLAMPGSNPESMAEQFTGTHSDELPGGFAAVVGTYVPPRRSSIATVRSTGRIAAEVVALMRRARIDVDEVREQTARLERYQSDLSTTSDARLQALLLLARDLLSYGWTVQGVVNLASGAALEVASKAGADTNATHRDNLKSGAALRGVRGLAIQALSKPELLELLSDRSPGLPERISAQAPEFWTQVQCALNEFGHRGPGEAEFDARSFADDIQGFLSTIGRAAASLNSHHKTDVPTESGDVALFRRPASRLLALREQNRDRVVRLTWLTRRLALEQGRRMAASGRLDCDRDVFNLTLAQLVDPPADAKDLVARRKGERARLAELHMPAIFLAKWQSCDVLLPLRPGESISGVGVCRGKVVGRARIIEPDTIDDLEPGEVMIAHVTDVGYTALFGHCGAVVTDIGGVMSHAAVVAREFGVTCVVDTQVAAARIPSGALVEVDGEAGTVTVLEAAPVAEPTS